MKNLKLLILIIFLFSNLTLIAQTGLPQYNIRCEREGNYIGDIKVELFRIITPLHVHNFDSLVSIIFYDTTAFHRVVPGFVIQGGDPNSRNGADSTWGMGDSSQTTVPAEFTNINHSRGILGAARDTDINSATSQFFINVANNSGLNGQYTAYGRVYDGMDVVDDIVSSPVVPGTERPQQKIEMFVTYLGDNNTVPEPPGLIFPEDGAEGVGLSQTFDWDEVTDAVLYRFQFSTDSTFNSTLIDTLLGFPHHSVSGLQQGLVKYYWRVQANNGGNVSNFSDTRSFTTGISAPILISPPDSATDVSTSPTFVWSSVEDAVSYTFQLSTFGSFINYVVNQSDIQDTTFQVTGLEENKKLYWRVRGVTDNYEGIFSQVFRFTTVSASPVPENGRTLSYKLEQNYPNPFNPLTQINFELAEPGFVSIMVYNVLGMEIVTLVEEEKPAGSFSVGFDATGLSNGIYFYKIKTGSFTQTKKMLLIK